MSSIQRRDLLPCLGLIAFALLIRLALLIAHPFDGLYGQDAYTYYAMAESLAGVRPYEGIYIWGVGYPALLVTGFSGLGATPGVAQGITLMLGILLSPLLYALARLSGASRTGSVISGILMALCGQAILSSVCVMSDIPALFWATASAVALLAYHRTRQSRWLIASAALLMMAIITRWNYALLVPIWGMVWLLSPQKQLRAIILAILAAVIIFLPQLAFSINRPSPTFFNYGSWDLARALETTFRTADGSQTFAQITALFYAQPLYDSFWLSPVFGVFALIGIAAALFSIRLSRIPLNSPSTTLRERSEGLPSILLALWLLLGYLFLCGIPQQTPRYGISLVPPIFVFVSRGFDLLWNWRILAIRAGVGLASIYGGLVMFQTGQASVSTFIAHQESDKAVVRAAIERLPADATLYTFELTPALHAYAPFTSRELYYETPASVATENPNGEIYLLVDLNKIRTQWDGMPLAATLDALIRVQDMRRIDQIGIYTLYQSVDRGT